MNTFLYGCRGFILNSLKLIINCILTQRALLVRGLEVCEANPARESEKDMAELSSELMSIKFERQNLVLAASLSHQGRSQLWLALFPIKNNFAEPHPPRTQGDKAVAGRASQLSHAQVPPEMLDRGHCPGHPGCSPGCCALGLNFTLKLESSGLHFQLNKTGTRIWSGVPPRPSISVFSFLPPPGMPSQGPLLLFTSLPQILEHFMVSW